jgi:predicted metalloenzyme YecM
MHTGLETFFRDAATAADAFDAWAKKASPSAKADHICYKCGSAMEFERLRAMFEASSAYVYQSVIAGRRIAIIKLTMPLATSLGDIWFLELSDQKPDGSQVSGFDHIEVYPLAGTMDELAAALAEKGTVFEKVVRPHHTTYDAKINGEFKVRLEPEQLIAKITAEEMV